MPTNKIQSNIKESIQRVGHAVMAVGPGEDEPGFTYSIGLGLKGWHELFMIGIDPRYAGQFINDIARGFKAQSIPLDHPCYVAGLAQKGYTFCLLPATPAVKENFTFQATHYYKGEDKYEVMQIIMCDANHRFPWQKGYQHAKMLGQTLMFAPPENALLESLPTYELTLNDEKAR